MLVLCLNPSCFQSPVTIEMKLEFKHVCIKALETGSSHHGGGQDFRVLCVYIHIYTHSRRYYFIPVRMTIIRKKRDTNVNEDVGKLEPLYSF